jgi:long-chain acyl-CoA synthetase
MPDLPTGARSAGARFLDRCARTPGAEAFRHPVPGGWASVTWTELADRARHLAAGLVALGVTAERRVAIAATTRLEWVLADLAILLADGTTTTVYPTTGAGDVAYILADSDAVVVFAEDADQVAKLRADGGWLADVRHVVTFDPVGDPHTLHLDDLAGIGRDYLRDRPGAVDEVLDRIGPTGWPPSSTPRAPPAGPRASN